MKILYVVGRFPVASETFIADEIRGLRARGIDLVVASLARPDANDLLRMGPGLKALMHTTRYIRRVNLMALSQIRSAAGVTALNCSIQRAATHKTQPLVRLTRAMAVAALARRMGAQMIHAHWPRPTEVALLASAMLDLPLSISVHAHEVAHDGGHFSVVFGKLRFASFCNAAAMNQLIEQLGPSAAERSCLIYHGVNLAQFEVQPMPEFSGCLRIATAGRLTASKGIDRLIRAVAVARRRGLDVTLTVIGDGAQRNFLEQFASDLQIADSIHFTSWIQHEMMHIRLGEAHIFALIADDGFHDGLPNVVLESMALGRPVVLSPLPAAKEAVLDGENGFILSAVDAPEEFADICSWLMNNPSELRSFGTRAAEYVRERFDRGPLLDKLCALFHSHCTSHGAARP